MGSRDDTYLLAGLDLLAESVAPVPLLRKLTSASRIGAFDGRSSCSWVCGSTTVSRAIMTVAGALVLQSRTRIQVRGLSETGFAKEAVLWIAELFQQLPQHGAGPPDMHKGRISGPPALRDALSLVNLESQVGVRAAEGFEGVSLARDAKVCELEEIVWTAAQDQDVIESSSVGQLK